MKRFVVMPGTVVLVVVFLALLLTLESRKVAIAARMPGVADSLIPGHLIPPGTPCYRGTLILGQSYCHPDQNVDIIIKDNMIVRTYVYTYPFELTIGELIVKWGAPVSTDYDAIGAMTVYWDGQYAYVMTQHGFTPNSRVGYIAYGKEQGPGIRAQSRWRGFVALGG